MTAAIENRVTMYVEHVCDCAVCAAGIDDLRHEKCFFIVALLPDRVTPRFAEIQVLNGSNEPR